MVKKLVRSYRRIQGGHRVRVKSHVRNYGSNYYLIDEIKKLKEEIEDNKKQHDMLMEKYRLDGDMDAATSASEYMKENWWLQDKIKKAEAKLSQKNYGSKPWFIKAVEPGDPNQQEIILKDKIFAKNKTGAIIRGIHLANEYGLEAHDVTQQRKKIKLEQGGRENYGSNPEFVDIGDLHDARKRERQEEIDKESALHYINRLINYNEKQIANASKKWNEAAKATPIGENIPTLYEDFIEPFEDFNESLLHDKKLIERGDERALAKINNRVRLSRLGLGGLG